jgi:DNA-binding MarR family transcriptional regulator
MDQEEILNAVRSKPGITQVQLRKQLECYGYDISNKLYKLRLKKLVRREKDKRTWRIYPI